MYRHASILYQYQDKQGNKPVTPHDVDALLLNFYLALDDGNLTQALTTLFYILDSVQPSMTEELSSVIERVESHLLKALSPEQEDIDQLTILLADQ